MILFLLVLCSYLFLMLPENIPPIASIFVPLFYFALTLIFILFHFIFIYFLLKDNCFIELCCFLSNLNLISPRYICPLPFEPPSHLSPSHPSRLIQSPCLSFLAIQQIPVDYLFYIW